ncbi:hypothetical protein [Mobilicoccus pelagius]|uniref:Transglycosylase SLT domain-containing protein n=1 Tax=Mobilicoccus pelagius NBRC 104925 TaxID=1089455 RepID=H5USA5_9MICO|nr:hypothetical protein [Mobilicoccus pelagius]GAB48613.1 hypothetical protein MOPEL_078_00020 [Mobilicoccus pelagius NBRC 104925]
MSQHFSRSARLAAPVAVALLAAGSFAAAPPALADTTSARPQGAAPAAVPASTARLGAVTATMPGHPLAGVALSAFALAPSVATTAASTRGSAAAATGAKAAGARAHGARSSRSSARAARSPKAVARSLASARGWGGRQFACLDALWTKESDWTATADNPTSSAYGIPQALPGRKMASHGADWRTNPATQIRWGLDYIDDVYGSPCRAWSHSRAHNWY